MLHLNNILMPDLLDGHLLCKYINHLDLHLKEGWQYLGHVILSSPHLGRRAWSKKHSPLPPKTLCRNIKDAWYRQNSAGESPRRTAIRNTAGKQCLARVLDPLQRGIPVGLLPYVRVPVPPPLASSGPSSPQEHVSSASPHQRSRNKQQYKDTCSLSIRYITEQELKPLIVPPTLIAIIYSLYCAMWTLRCHRNLQTVGGYFKGSFLLLSPSIWFPSEETDLTTTQLYSTRICYCRPAAPSAWQRTIVTPAYYRIVVSLPAAYLQQI